jgi:hypothetical protein
MDRTLLNCAKFSKNLHTLVWNFLKNPWVSQMKQWAQNVKFSFFFSNSYLEDFCASEYFTSYTRVTLEICKEINVDHYVKVP